MQIIREQSINWFDIPPKRELRLACSSKNQVTNDKGNHLFPCISL